jgi:3-deoxy-manno-octulosonate cytidylyltransferase (CMP-KDO synthetase)
MIVWVAERAAAASRVKRVIVATDDSRVVDVVQANGYEAVMTRADHASGTDRLAEVVNRLDGLDIIVNVQGDEPLISPETIDLAIIALEAHPEAGIATTWEPINSVADVLSPDVVKIVVSQDQRALYFSRSPIPYPRDVVTKHGSLEVALKQEPGLLRKLKKHTGLYVYRRDVLMSFTNWPRGELEKHERLEQLRALENGVTIVAVEAARGSIGVDTAADLQRVQAMMT